LRGVGNRWKKKGQLGSVGNLTKGLGVLEGKTGKQGKKKKREGSGAEEPAPLGSWRLPQFKGSGNRSDCPSY